MGGAGNAKKTQAGPFCRSCCSSPYPNQFHPDSGERRFHPRPAPAPKGQGDAIAYSVDPSLSFPQQESAPVYVLEPASREDLLAQIAGLFGIEDLTAYPSVYNADLGEEFFTLEDRDLTVSLNTQNGMWAVTPNGTQEPNPAPQLPSEEEAVRLVRESIEANQLFEGDLGEPTVSYSYAGEGDQRRAFEVQVAFHPSVEGRPVYGLYRIVMVLGNGGETLSAYQQAAPVKASGSVKLKTQDQTVAELLNHPENAASTAEGAGEALVTDCQLGYYFDGAAENGTCYLLPVYQLSARTYGGRSAPAQGQGVFTALMDAAQRDSR